MGEASSLVDALMEAKGLKVEMGKVKGGASSAIRQAWDAGDMHVAALVGAAATMIASRYPAGADRNGLLTSLRATARSVATVDKRPAYPSPTMGEGGGFIVKWVEIKAPPTKEEELSQGLDALIGVHGLKAVVEALAAKAAKAGIKLS
jgi:hypothetical protein